MQSLITRVTKGSNLLLGMLFVIVAASFTACSDDDTTGFFFDVEAQKKIDEQIIRKYFRDNNVDTTAVTRTNSGLYYLNLEPGTGDTIKTGNLVEAHYIGEFTNGAVFDSSYDRGKPITFTVGAQQVIKGWDEGLQLMKVGEEKRFFIPSHLGYGYTGRGNVPPNMVLIFDIKVLRKK